MTEVLEPQEVDLKWDGQELSPAGIVAGGIIHRRPPPIAERLGDMHAAHLVARPQDRRSCAPRAARGDSRAPTAASPPPPARSSLRPGSSGVATLSSSSPSASALVRTPMRRHSAPLWTARAAATRAATSADAFGRRRQDEIGGGDRRHFDMQVDAVEQRPGKFAPDNRPRSAGARAQASAAIARDGRSGRGSSPPPAETAPDR